MSGSFVFGHIQVSSVVLYPSQRGPMFPNGAGLYSRQTLPTDPAGTFFLRLQNIIEGSRYRIETLSQGITLSEGVAESSNVILRLELYAAGSPYNDLRIKVRNASGTPTYRPFESQAVAQLGTVTIFVFQELDE